MSYIKDIVEKVLPVDVGEEFNIILDDGRYCMYNPFKFTETDLVDTHGGVFTNYIGRIITGDYKIEKIPFVPKIGEKYFTYTDGVNAPVIRSYYWHNDCYEKERKLLGILFRTEQEAKDYLPTWEKRLEGEV